MIIIALTGWGQEGDKERSREAGCDGHLVKPVNLADLQKLLADVPRVAPGSKARRLTEPSTACLAGGSDRWVRHDGSFDRLGPCVRTGSPLQTKGSRRRRPARAPRRARR